MAAVTADQVVVELKAKVDQYNQKINQSEANFSQKMAKMSQDAIKAGNASAIAFNAASKTFDKVTPQLGKVADGSKMAQQQMRNLAFQFQDIGTMMAAGQSPFMLLAQQLPQVTMYGGQMTGVMGALKQTISGLISPLGIATTAFVILGSAAVSYFDTWFQDAPDMEEILKKHKSNIDALGPSYKQAIEDAKKYIEQNQEVAKALSEAIFSDAKKVATQDAKDLVSEVGRAIASALSGAGVMSFDGSGAFQPLVDAFERFKASVEAGTPDITRLREEIVKAGNADASIKKLSLSLLQLTNDANGTANIVSGIEKALDPVARAFDIVHQAIGQINSKDAQKDLSDLESAMKNGQVATQDVSDAIQHLSGKYPDLSEAIRQVGALGLVAIETKAQLKEMSELFKRSLGGEAGKAGRLNKDNNMDAMTEMYRSQYEMWRRMNPEAFKLEKTLERQNKQLDKQKKSKKERDDPWERYNKRIQDNIDLAETEYEVQRKLNPLVEDYGYALEFNRVYQEGLNAARKAGRTLDADEIAALQEKAAYLALVKSGTEQVQEEQSKLRQTAQEWESTTRDATRGLVDDLVAGKDAAEAFANALQKIIDKLLDMVFDDIFASIFGSGNGGNIGALGKLLGFSGGGYTGSGGVTEPAGVVHKGEVVWSQSDIRKAGGVGVVEAMRRGVRGYAIGGPVDMVPFTPTSPVMPSQQASSATGRTKIDVGVSVDNDGNLQAYVKNVASQTSQNTVKAYDKSGPMRFARDSKQASRRGLVR
ncbi:phage tail length tape measure family protein [Brucella sp. HL-2]|nr:phage tail length tape measure family protein [Brucella sp. HL-2]MCV9909916.1 phage tail length tape measure family protein [Brucella sp. HL-2]